jgi:hypothetical protein
MQHAYTNTRRQEITRLSKAILKASTRVLHLQAISTPKAESVEP